MVKIATGSKRPVSLPAHFSDSANRITACAQIRFCGRESRPNFEIKLTAMKRIIQMTMMLCVCLLYTSAQTPAEDKPVPGRNSVYLEGAGNGIIYSINYDHLFSMKKHPKLGVGVRIGISYGNYDNSLFWGSLTTIPAEAYFSYGRKNCLELGSGYTTIFEGKYPYGMPTVRLGYRYRGPGGIVLGAGVTGFIETYGMYLIPQLSVGFSF